MISICPHCQQQLGLTESQQQQIEKALAALESGKKLKFACPQCKKTVEVGAAAGAGSEVPPSGVIAQPPSPGKAVAEFSQPQAPDISWFTDGELGEKDIIDDVPRVLVMVNDDALREKVFRAFESMGYKPESPASPAEAMDRMRFVAFDAVILHILYEGSLEASTVHGHMKKMVMPKRRRIYYMLIGPDFHTLYDLEALACSANLVINESEIDSIGLILRKGLRDYEALFGPFLAALEAKG